MSIINSFSGQYSFLSNFYTLRDGKTVEHYYQAAKACNMSDRLRILNAATPGYAKKLGKNIQIRDDWYGYKFLVMEYELVRKFSDPKLMQKLLSTGKSLLIEENWWGDRIWGVCDGVGENRLGKMLMNIRDNFIDAKQLVEY